MNFYFPILIFILVGLSSCKLRITKINDKSYEPDISYLVTDSLNEISFKGIGWQLDSVKLGSLSEKGQVYVKDSIIPYNNIVFFKRSWGKGRDSLHIISSRLPNLSLKLFPYDLGDTLDFDNLRFLRYRFVSDSSSFEYYSQDVLAYFCSFDSLSMINSSNKFSKEQLAEIFKIKPKKIQIDSIMFDKNGFSFVEKVDTSFILSYPYENLYQMFDEPGVDIHVNSLRTLAKSPVGLKKRILTRNDVESYVISKYTGDKSEYFYKDRFYMNLGELRGLNHIVVKNERDELLFDRIIDGSNQRIEDFLNFFGSDKLYIKVRGYYNWDLTITFI